ncbi:MAG: hypothetical protein ACT4QG_09740 [Sporichthyaceae bacterium]
MSSFEPSDEYEDKQSEFQRQQDAFQVELERQERLQRKIFRWTAAVVAVLGFLAICSMSGYSVGPGAGSATICEAAGGQMKDRVIMHRCANR